MRRTLGCVLGISLLLVSGAAGAPARGGKGSKVAKPSKTARSTAVATTAATPAPSSVGTVLHRHEYSIGYDPHPTNYAPLDRGSVSAGGRTIAYLIDLIEGWSSDASPYLKTLGAKVTVKVAGESDRVIELPAAAIEAAKLKPGFVLGERSVGGLGVRIRLAAPVVDKKRLVGITVVSELFSTDADQNTPVPSGSDAAAGQPAVQGADAAGATPDAPEAAPAPPRVAGDGSDRAQSDAAAAAAESDGGAAGAPTASAAPAGAGTAVAMARALVAKADALTAPSAARARDQLLRRARFVIADHRSSEALALLAGIDARLGGSAGANDRSPNPESAPPPALVATGAGTTGTAASAVAPDVAGSGSPNPPVDAAPAAAAAPVAKPVSADEAAAWRRPPSPEARALLAAADRKLVEGNAKEGLDLLHQATWKDPESHAVWVHVGRKTYGLQEYKEARDAFERAVALRPDDAESALMACRARMYLGDEGPAIEMLKRMAARHPDRVEVHNALCEALFITGRYSSCLEECQRVLDRFPGDARTLELLQKARERR